MPSARRIRWAKIRIGVTVFAALLILGVLLALLTGGTVFEDRAALRTYMRDASGIAEDSPVRLNGIPIGRITEVRFSGSKDPNRIVEVRMEVASRYLSQMPSDSVASITSENVQGEKYLDLQRGKSRQTVRPGAEIAFQPTPEVLKTIDLAQFEARLRSILETLDDIEAGKGQVGRLVKGDALYRGTLARIIELQRALRAAMGPQQELGRLLYQDALYEGLLVPVRRLDQSLARLERGEGRTGKWLRDGGRYDRLRERMRGLRRQIAELNAGRGPAGRLLRHDGAYADWNRRIADLIRTVDDVQAGQGTFGQLLYDASVYESLAGASRELARTLRDFREDPRKYLRVELF